ncbi:helix-turn-helix domain-containing protein [Rhodoferax sp.]|uniref:helix-turn-helix domain-containing protein n=1 Tax=Rhodoferax sp. TaxID=50421 RepID=UPI002618356D|nr:helix-turn-helix domain-containing protein [Rhodoferax sp.]MDD2925725.1 helix-turn-helix domain-containing protein [Rhodoferax sp.]
MPTPSMAPTPQWRATQSAGVDQLAQSISGWEQVYDQTSPGRFHGALTELMLGPVQLFIESSSHALVQTCKTWAGATWFGIPVQHRPMVRVDGTGLAPGMLALHSGQGDFQLTTPDDFGFLGIVVQTDWLQHYAASQHSALPPALLTQRVLQLPDDALEAVRRWLCQLLLVQPAQLQGLSAQAQQHLLDEVVSGLVQMLTHGKHGPRDNVSAQHARRMLRRVRDYLQAHTERCVTVHELCEQLGSSPRALQDCFRKHVGLSPKAYLKAVKLNQARRELRCADSTCASVSDVAVRYGFWHLSQFAADYRWLFGELPSETLRRRGAGSF